MNREKGFRKIATRILRNNSGLVKSNSFKPDLNSNNNLDYESHFKDKGNPGLINKILENENTKK